MPNSVDDDTMSDAGSDISGNRKRNAKFKALTGDGKPLGDRELMLKKNRTASLDVSSNAPDQDSDALGSGLFDRFSSARKTLGRGSLRRRKDSDEDTKSLYDAGNERKSSKVGGGSDWRAKLASKFKKTNGDQNNEENSSRKNSMEDDYSQLKAPMTEPTRRRPMSVAAVSDVKANGSAKVNKLRVSVLNVNL